MSHDELSTYATDAWDDANDVSLGFGTSPRFIVLSDVIIVNVISLSLT